jgi:hypothetical protein
MTSHLKNIIRDGILFSCVFDINITLGNSLDQNISRIVHFDFAALKERYLFINNDQDEFQGC